MTGKELIRAVADEQRIPISRAAAVINTALDIIIKQVARGEKVQLLGFGTFKRTQYRARNVTNPRTGESMHIRKFKTPSFTASKSFKAAVKS